MAQFTQDGIIYEELPDGNVRVVGYAPAPSATVAPSAVRLAEKQRDADKDAQAQADREADNVRADRAEARAQEKDDREARQWSAKFFPDGSPRPVAAPLTKQQMGAARMKLQGINAIANQVARVESALEKAEKGGFVGPIYGNVPFSGKLDGESAALDKSIAQLAPLIRQLTRTPGEGAMSDYESRLAAMALPSRSDNPAALKESLSGIRDLLAQNRLGYLEMLGEAPQGQRAPDELDKAAALPDTSPPGLPPTNEGGNDPGVAPQTVAQGEYRFADNPRARSTIASLINAGAGYSTVAAAAKKAGGRAPSIQEFNAVRSWMKANPGKEYPASAVEAGEYQPLTLLQKVSGSALGTGVANYANAATAGLAGAVAGERGKGAIDAMKAMHPGASLTGNLLGGITGAAGGEAVLGAKLAGTAAAKFAPRIADVAYGGLYGFNEAADGEGLAGAGLGAFTGLAGGYLGEKALRGAGAALKGATAPASRRLREAGVPLTVGQVLGDGGWAGRAVKKVEDALTAIPGVGNMVEARRMEGLQGFNDAAFDLAAETTGNEITETGARGVAQLKQAISDAYGRALDPVSINVDDEALVADLGQTIASARRIPNVDSAQDAALMGLKSRITGAIDPETEIMSGRGFQEAYRGLARTGRERANKDYGYEVGQVMRQGQDALAGALERQNPGAFDAFVNANAANRRANVLAQAINPNAPEQLITPAQLGRADFNSTSKLENRINAAAGNGPFFDLAEAGQAVLPSKLPDSGTWTRMLTGGLLTGTLGGGGAAIGGADGAGIGTGGGLAATTLLALGGSKPVQRAAVSALLDRPEALTRAGKLLADLAKFGGGVGAGTATPLLVGQ